MKSTRPSGHPQGPGGKHKGARVAPAAAETEVAYAIAVGTGATLRQPE